MTSKYLNSRTQLISVFVFLNYLTLVSCTKPFELDITNAEKRIVVEGNVYSSPGPYLVRLTYSRKPLSSQDEDPTPIKDATVIISDNYNNEDTLINPPDSIIGFKKFYKKVGENLVLDSVFVRGINSFTKAQGYYQTSKIRGIPGRKYKLTIVLEGKTYIAEETMPDSVLLDSVGYTFKYSLKDNKPYKVATLYFEEPQDRNNYYLAPSFGFSSIDEDAPVLVPIFSTRQCFPATLFDDKLLASKVSGIPVDETCGKEQIATDKIAEWGNAYLFTLSEGYYNYIKVLFDQLKSDGGAYKPTPANPASNISNNALGYFGAVAVSRKFYYIK